MDSTIITRHDRLELGEHTVNASNISNYHQRPGQRSQKCIWDYLRFTEPSEMSSKTQDQWRYEKPDQWRYDKEEAIRRYKPCKWLSLQRLLLALLLVNSIIFLLIVLRLMNSNWLKIPRKKTFAFQHQNIWARWWTERERWVRLAWGSIVSTVH